MLSVPSLHPDSHPDEHFFRTLLKTSSFFYGLLIVEFNLISSPKPSAMKKQLLCLFLLTSFISPAFTQVTRLSNNTSYEWGFPLNNSKTILRSTLSNTLWAYDIASNTFTQLSSAVTVQADYSFGFFNGEFYFAGRTALEGIELWKTNGTPGGTAMVKDINLGGGDANPHYGFIVYNNELYFTAIDGNGRELWKTNGAFAGTLLVKDINPGPANAFSTTTSNEFGVVNGLLVFTATTATDGDELWQTNGTLGGTSLIQNIEPFPTLGSRFSSFTEYNNTLIFTASDISNGDRLWKTDGTIIGTSVVKDINTNPPSGVDIAPYFFNFQNILYFAANDGTNGFELWRTNGTTGGTTLVKDINPGAADAFPFPGIPSMLFAVKNSSLFFFTATTAANGAELWESDGTLGGTQLLIDITGDVNPSDPIILPNFFGASLFQGNKFFFIANTPGVEGNEFYVSDGTAVGTELLNGGIYPGLPSGFNGIDLAWFYGGDKFYFVADNGIDGAELWESNGTSGAGTKMSADVNTNAGEGSSINTMINVGSTLFFFGTDGDDPTNTDYFKLDASLLLPLRWISFEARPSNNDVLLLWQTATEDQTDHFVVQRSADGVNYKDIGQVAANGTGSNSYSFTDAGAMKLAVKKWYYRIKDVDKDNKFALSRVATVALNKSIASILILPNPVVNELKLVIQAASNDQATIRVINMKGQVVLEKTTAIVRGKNTVITDASGLSNGVYMLQITAGESSTTERIMIQH